ncbi:MAG TPA: aminotransferase class I/II-fold pyridoxal phosphate-dependent enzyme [Gemmatimonadaceae bacterium]|jgi:glycine C-acetyltransferase
MATRISNPTPPGPDLSDANAANGGIADFDYSNFYYSSSDDIFAIFDPYNEWWYGHARDNGYYLFSQPMSTPPGPRIDLEEQLGHERLKLLNLASYNYLGLSYHPEVIAASKKALDHYGLGAAGSPILSGTMEVHVQLEKALATFKKKDAVMVFPTGYSTNVGVIQALMRPGDWIIMDQNVHASIVDGAILSKANVRFFRHNRPDDLERKLRGTTGKRLVIMEGVYSMDGDEARLPEIVEVAKRHGARTMIDEAHSTFLYGKEGRGLAEKFGLEDDIDIHVGTFSKALGGMGGFVAGSQALYNYLMGFARSRVFSCALSPVVSAGVLQALRIQEREPQLRERLWENVAYMRGHMAAAGIDVGESTSQIIPIMIRNDRKIFGVAQALQRAGLYLQPIIYPAVAKNRSRFRISISATHTSQQLDEAANILSDVLQAEGVR